MSGQKHFIINGLQMHSVHYAHIAHASTTIDHRLVYGFSSNFVLKNLPVLRFVHQYPFEM